MKAGRVTLSDRVSAGTHEDLIGPGIECTPPLVPAVREAIRHLAVP